MINLLAAIDFLAAARLGALGVVAIPVIAHWLSYRSGRTLIMPTVKFFIEAHTRHVHKFRLRDIALLLIRILIVVFIVLVFARPVWLSSSVNSVNNQIDTKNGVDLIIVIDASASMQHTVHGQTFFDQAKLEAGKLLDSLNPEKDQAVIILANAQPDTLLPRLSANLTTLKRELSAAQPTWQRADIPATFNLARKILTKASDNQGYTHSIIKRPVQLHIFTDCQKTQWSDYDKQSLSVMAVNSDNLHIHPIGTEINSGNWALANLNITPITPVINQTVIVSLDVTNYSAIPAAPEIILDYGKDLQIKNIDTKIEAYSKKTISFQIQFQQAGCHNLTVSIINLDNDNEGLYIDNKIDTMIKVIDKKQVGLLTASTADLHVRKNTNAAYFVNIALVPDQDAPIEVVLLDNHAITNDSRTINKINNLDSIIVCETDLISDTTAHILLDYITRGNGGIFWIIDSEVSVDSLNRLGALLKEDMELPVTEINWNNNNFTNTNPHKLSQGLFDQPPLQVFSQRSAASDYSGILNNYFYQYAECKVTSSSKKLLSYDNDQPALISGYLGKGKMLILTGSIHPDNSSLIRNPIFPAVVNEIVNFISPGISKIPTFKVGENMYISIQMNRDKTSYREIYTRPEISFTLQTDDNPDDNDTIMDVSMNLQPAGQPGTICIYADNNDNNSNNSPQPRQFINILFDERESDLRTLNALALKNNLLYNTTESSGASGNKDSVMVSLNGNESVELFNVRPEERELWPICLIMALILSGLELIITSKSR